MPPKKLKCAFMEGRRRCQRAAAGNPPLCDVHRVLLEDEARADSARPGQSLASILGDVIAGKRVTEDQWRSGLEDFVSVFQRAPADSWIGSRRDATMDAVRARVGRVMDPTAWGGRGARPQADRPDPPHPPPRKRPPDPTPQWRAILGFSVREPLTADAVKRRHREMARTHHPDRGGSVEKMQQINVAAEGLLATLA